MADLTEIGITNGDLNFLKEKADSGDLVFATGSRTTTGVITSYTPATGKTFYLVGASWFLGSTSSNTLAFDVVQVRNNAVVRDTIGGSIWAASGGGGSYTNRATSHVKGDTLIGNGVKTYDLNLSTASAQTVYGSIFGWIEDT